MEDTPAIAEPSQTAADSSTAGSALPPELRNLSLEALDVLLTKGTLEIPAAGGKEGTPPPAAKVETETPPGEKPAEEVETPIETTVETPVEQEVEIVETRSEEQIQADVDAAIEKVQAAGGDATAQRAAADEAAKPVAEHEEEETGIAGIERPRLKESRDQLIAGIYMHAKREADAGRGTALTWAEAEARVDGPPPAAPVAPEVEQPVDYVNLVAGLETEVTDIKKKLSDAGVDEGLFNSEIAKLTVELTEKTADLKLAQRDLKNATTEAERKAVTARSKSEENRQASKIEAIEDYPMITDDSSELSKAVKAEIVAMKDPDHPDHAILFADSAPLLTTQKVARRLGIMPIAKKAAAKAAAPSSAKVVAPPKKMMSPVSAAKTAVQTPKPAEDAKKTLEYLRKDATLAELDKFFGMGSQQQLLAGAAR